MVVVILAAGTATRMGCQKLLLPVDGVPMIQRVVRAAAAWPIVVVAGAQVAPVVASSTVRVVSNDRPERGMSYSLRLADAVIAADEPLAVVLGDLPDISALSVAAVCDAYHAHGEHVDIAVARYGERFGHPVVFGPRARRKIAALPDGDTLAGLRDDRTLRRCIVDVDVPALMDIDTPADYAQRVGRPLDPVESSP